MYSLDDTIAAIATSIGFSGIGIIKISGPDAPSIASKIFRSARGKSRLKPYRLRYGTILDPRTEEIVDEALVVHMPRPHSYTRQDIVEIQVHGGIVPLQRVLQLVLSLGARPAEAGEMTLRAFLNGRLDLAQAEAVLDIIESKTEAALRVAAEQLTGSLSAQVSEIRTLLLSQLAFLEASIDFVEDEIPFQDIVAPLHEVSNRLKRLLKSANYGQIYRQGVKAAIVGQPNVGKSSLLNALLRGDRAIVTSIPGTTRDTLEETANVGGVPLVLVDTAGIRSETVDEVERIGVDRSRTALKKSDIALMVIDGTRPLGEGDWEIAQLVHGKPALLVVNKTDLTQTRNIKPPREFLPDAPRAARHREGRRPANRDPRARSPPPWSTNTARAGGPAIASGTRDSAPGSFWPARARGPVSSWWSFSTGRGAKRWCRRSPSWRGCSAEKRRTMSGWRLE